MIMKAIIQASRSRRSGRTPVTVVRPGRKVGFRWRAAAVAMTASVALSACGGGGGGGSAPTETTQATPAPAAPKTVLIEEYGDSTTAGLQIFNGVPSYTANSEPVDLQNDLQQQFGPSVTVTNHGISGTQASELLSGAHGFGLPWDQQMAASKANIVTLNFMRNDADYCGVPTAGETCDPPEQYAQVLTQLIQIARSHGKQVVLYEPDPTAFSDGNSAIELYLVQLKSVVSEQQVPVVFTWEYAQGLPDYASLLSDGVHPTDALYADNASWEAPVLAPIVQALLR
jgi:lysophospholipase L1-like esterase